VPVEEDIGKYYISRKEAERLIVHLCKEVGAPIPLFGTLHESSYDDGAYYAYKIELKDKVPIFVAIHEFFHYIIDLIRKEDDIDFTDDTLEHRFIFYISNLFSKLLYEEYRKNKTGNNRPTGKRRPSNT
jgi:hypothetical protein